MRTQKLWQGLLYQALNVKMDLRYWELLWLRGSKPWSSLKMGDNVSGLFSTKPSQQQALGILEQSVSFRNAASGLHFDESSSSLDSTRILNYNGTRKQRTKFDLLRQREPLMSILEGACDRLKPISTKFHLQPMLMVYSPAKRVTHELTWVSVISDRGIQRQNSR